jgi:hypothetical protein
MLAFDEIEANLEGYRAVNGVELQAGHASHLSLETVAPMFLREKCRYCGERLRRSTLVVGNPQSANGRAWWMFHCVRCTHWGVLGEYYQDAYIGLHFLGHMATARTFEESLPEGCEPELAMALRRHASKWSDFDPTRLEKFVGEVLRANYQSCDVVHLGKVNDGGVDLLIADPAGEKVGSAGQATHHCCR